MSARNATAMFAAYSGYVNSLRVDGRSGVGCVVTFAEWLCGPGSVVTVGQLESLAAAPRGSLVVRRCLAEGVAAGRGELRVVSGVVDADGAVGDGDVDGGGVDAEVESGPCESRLGVGSATAESVGDSRAKVVVDGSVRGPNWARNRAWKEEKKRKKKKTSVPVWRRGAVPVAHTPSLSATVCTVDTACAEELEARRTLAVRRAAENEVAVALAGHRLAALKDTSRTEAVARLAAARMEERINTAKARSQASYKKCDESLKSLGSTGSAGEFALKQEAKKAQDLAVEVKYLSEQLEKLLPHVPASVQQEIAAMPEPKKMSAWDVFGDCPSDYNEDEQEAYYNDLTRMDMEAAGYL